MDATDVTATPDLAPQASDLNQAGFAQRSRLLSRHEPPNSANRTPHQQRKSNQMS
jgi:hypothetical protein